MKKAGTAKAVKNDLGGGDQIAAYAQALQPAFRSMCEGLRGMIDAALPKATSKIWHGGPVWFIDENPVVGYNATAKTVNLLYWNGQAFDEAGLQSVGKYRAAQAKFGDPDEIDAKVIRRWLKKAESDVLDSKALFARKRAAGKTDAPLPKSMVTGKASSAKAAVGDKPVFAYIAGLPQPQRAIAETVDALAARTLPGLQRSVKWGMSYYGVGDGWCFACGGFDGHVKLMFINGTALHPVPPVTPVAMGKATRGVELKSVDEIDEPLIASWMKQVAAAPGVGGKKR